VIRVLVINFLVGFFSVVVMAQPALQVEHMNTMIDKPFLDQAGESLAGDNLVFPYYFKQFKVSFVAYGFSRKAGDDFDSWLKPFQDRYSETDDVFFISIPMIGKLPKWILRQMKKGMKKGIDVTLHPHQMIYSGDTDRYQDYYGFNNKKKGYFLLINSQGTIIWQAEGKATDALLLDLFTVIDSVVAE